MNEDSKKPLWPWIAALLIGLPVLLVFYVLSPPPVELLVVKIGEPEWLIASLRVFYAPLVWLVAHVPEPVIQWYQAYAECWIDTSGAP